ncbi:MAG: hypothetical protein MJK14_12440 [Rivularia sp. ALOHA_DT_140]|nr:hypothetical protein [Rivularia sp. ALOHA_DT_140]
MYNDKLKINKYKTQAIKYVELIESHRTTIQGYNNRAVQGDNNYAVQGDGNQTAITNIGRDKNKITINNKQVEISSDISQTLSDFKDILNEMIIKSPDPVEAISCFAKELIEELRDKPEIKPNLKAQEDSDEQKLVNRIIIDLLTKSYEQINQIIQTYPINQSNQIQNMNTVRNLEYPEFYITTYENDRDVIEYKGYIIELAKDHDNMWNFKIRRENNPDLCFSSQRRSRSKDNAIGKAKKKNNEDRMLNWINE